MVDPTIDDVAIVLYGFVLVDLINPTVAALVGWIDPTLLGDFPACATGLASDGCLADLIIV